jgi:hypothetical protein
MQSTRDDSTVSAFTPRGLLKLLESEGNDISNWPDIAKIIEPSLQVNLMLHQIHGVCWMVQMEHLEGFGINSLVWEEREFADGGKWYYSPAVGQARLSLGGKLGKPPVMKGGILSDEMGLGVRKTRLDGEASSVNRSYCTNLLTPDILSFSLIPTENNRGSCADSCDFGRAERGSRVQAK